ncbi:uncharacterized protein LOC126797345 [Argentina anserina]|uniref:uncharacterized protein LOC126797345 n=1 Tax=Argentina anserina TaxID=57926 RepID=UPI00217647D2|nr:uncharacterized protein LOC126797345 [Potentilla anserina]
MGCCLGTSRSPKPVPPPLNNGPNHFRPQKPNSLTQIQPKSYAARPETRSPPPPPVVEEETVKEVLSETPFPKPQTADIPPEKTTLSPPPKEEPKLPAEPPPPRGAASEPSQLTESCGVSESYSYSTTTTATTVADGRDDEATSNRKRELGPRANGASGPVRRKRPYSGEVSSQRERGPKPQQRRTPEPAVEKRNRTETASFRGRESSQLRTMQRSGAVPTGVRRETVSSRSRSPATRNVGGVNRAGRGKSPAKVAGRGGGSSSSVGVEEGEKKGNCKEAKEEVLAGKKEAKEVDQPKEGGVSQPQQGNESLDNPLVSLECFIFV